MKKINKLLVLGILMLLTACNFSKSVSTDLMTGLTTKGNGLSVDEVYISDGTDKLRDNTFFYGQEIYTYFTNVDGFVVENGNIYPEMEVAVTSKGGDIVFQNNNLLGGKSIEATTADLNGNVILAAPIQSGETYIVKYKVKDTKGEGVFYSELELELEKDPKIKLIEKGLSIKEAYIFDQDNRTIITNGEIGFDNNIILDLQGLKGYELINGNASLGMSVKVTDAKNTLILDLPDLLKDRSLTDSQIKQGLGSTVKINKGVLANPVHWQVRLWDKNSTAEMTATVTLNIENK